MHNEKLNNGGNAMNKRTLIIGLVLILSITIFVTACANRTEMAFGESDAITYVLEEHKRIVEELEFPSKVGETKTVEINVGGKPPGLTIPVELTTNVEKIDEKTFYVTLTKAWKDTGKDVISYWTYKVAPKEVFIIESQNNDVRFLTIK